MVFYQMLKASGKALFMRLNVAFMGLIIDHLLSAWAKEREEALGLA